MQIAAIVFLVQFLLQRLGYKADVSLLILIGGIAPTMIASLVVIRHCLAYASIMLSGLIPLRWSRFIEFARDRSIVVGSRASGYRRYHAEVQNYLSSLKVDEMLATVEQRVRELEVVKGGTKAERSR